MRGPELSPALSRLIEKAALDPEFEGLLLSERSAAARSADVLLEIPDAICLDSLPSEALVDAICLARSRVWRAPRGLGRATGVAVAAVGIGLLGSAGALALDPTDTDGDGVTDDYENNVSLTDPLNPDSDFDGLSDGYELFESVTVYGEPLDPLDQDTDGDDLPDGWEDFYRVPTACIDGLDPTNASGTQGTDGDPDGDGYSNIEEYAGCSDPTDPESWPYEISGAIAGCTAGTPPPLASVGLPLAAALMALRKRWSVSAPGRVIEARP